MMGAKTSADPVAAALDAADGTVMRTSNVNRIDQLFGDRPQVLASIIAANKRGIPKREIARILTAAAPVGVVIKDGSVSGWLAANDK